MSRQECFNNRYPYPPSQWNLGRVQEVLSKRVNPREGCTLWEGLCKFGFPKLPLPNKFQVLAWGTEESYLVIKVYRTVYKYIRKSLWKASSDMIQARCRLSTMSAVFNPQTLLDDGIVSSPFCGGRRVPLSLAVRVHRELKARGFLNLHDIRPGNMFLCSDGVKIIDFTIVKTNMGDMMDYYRWDNVLQDISI